MVCKLSDIASNWLKWYKFLLRSLKRLERFSDFLITAVANSHVGHHDAGITIPDAHETELRVEEIEHIIETYWSKRVALERLTKYKTF